MKFPPFAYRAPRSIEEAVELLASDPQAKVLAGGQSLLPLLALRIAQPSLLVDVGSIDGLSYVQTDDGLPQDWRSHGSLDSRGLAPGIRPGAAPRPSRPEGRPPADP